MILYIIPGFGESTKDTPYQEIIKDAKKQGFETVTFDPIWKRKTIKNWLEDFNLLIKTKGEKDSIVIGFSFGAYIAVLSSIDHKFKKIILCSLSPYFEDDIKELPPLAHKILGKKRIEDFSKNKFPTKVNTPAIFIVGDKDFPLLIEEVKKNYKRWAGPKKVKILKDVKHNIGDDLYLKTIKEII